MFIQARGVLKKDLMAHLHSRRIMRRGKTASTAGQTSAQTIDAVSIRDSLAEIEDRALSAPNAMTSFVYLYNSQLPVFFSETQTFLLRWYTFEMKNFLIISLAVIYIVLSAFLEASIGGRIVIADIFLVLLICISFTIALVDRSLHVSNIALMFFPLLFIFLISAITARYPDRAALEWIILVFNILGAIALANILVLLPERGLLIFFRAYVLALGALALVCLIDFFIMPGLISSRSLGGIQGPFRNTGQAGSFFGVHAILALALLIGRVVPVRPIYIIATSLIFFALIFTLKRSSNLAFIVGVMLAIITLISSRSIVDKKIGIGFLFALGCFFVASVSLFTFGLGEVEGLRSRLEYKFNFDVLQNAGSGFIGDNIQSAITAFSDNPFWGVGLGNVAGVYQFHEIHSTYLGILANGGILGMLLYSMFMYTLLFSIYRESKFKKFSPWAAFLWILLPLLIGQMVGWGYTTHIRKREFWILVVFVIVTIKMSKRMRTT
jgi:O-antigen ligase